MAITAGNTSSSGDPGTVNTAYSWLHTCVTDSNILIVAARAKESTDADRIISGITYDGNPLTKAIAIQHDPFQFGAELWYLVDPTVDSELSIEVTHTGKTTDPSAGAIDFGGVDTDTGVVEDTDTVFDDTNVPSVVCATGDMIIGVFQTSQSLFSDINFTGPATIEIDAVDTGSYTAHSGYNTGLTIQSGSLSGATDYAGCAFSFNAAAEEPSTLSAYINDTISITESVSNFFDLLRITIVDSVTLAEATENLGQLAITLPDSISVVEDVTFTEAIPDLSININDTISISEAIDFLGYLMRTVTDSVSITDLTQELLDKIVININDSISAVEYIESIGQLSISVNDSITAAEGITPAGKSLADIYDSIAIAEALESLGFLSRDINDSISISEALSFLGLLSVDINDSISIVEDLAKSIVALGFDKDVNDSISIAEFLGTLGYEYADISDSITVTEVLTFLGQLVADINDSITISESLNFLGYLFAVVNDNITITENVARLTTSYRTVNDTVSVNESLSFLGKLQISINDSLSITEALTFLGLLSADITDTVTVVENLADNLYTVGNITISISDTITVSEFLSFALHLQVSVTDAITVIELISTGKADGFFRRPWCRRLSGPFGRGDLFVS